MSRVQGSKVTLAFHNFEALTSLKFKNRIYANVEPALVSSYE